MVARVPIGGDLDRGQRHRGLEQVQRVREAGQEAAWQGAEQIAGRQDRWRDGVAFDRDRDVAFPILPTNSFWTRPRCGSVFPSRIDRRQSSVVRKAHLLTRTIPSLGVCSRRHASFMASRIKPIRCWHHCCLPRQPIRKFYICMGYVILLSAEQTLQRVSWNFGRPVNGSCACIRPIPTFTLRSMLGLNACRRRRISYPRTRSECCLEQHSERVLG